MASDGATPEPEPASARRSWQGQGAAAGADARAARQRFRIVVLAGVLAALLALVIVLVRYFSFSPQPSPHFLAINVAEHNHKHFPPQAFARADSELLMRHFDEGKKKEAATRSKELLRAELRGLKDRSAQPLVIHLTAPALVRDDIVYLLPGDAEPDDDATWLKVDEVLRAVEECPAKQKLLILDLAHGLVDPRLGVCADRVAEALEAQLRKQEPSFLVLCPCAAGQSSLTSEVLRSSVLAYYVDLGLHGDADADQNGSVTVKELVNFVQPRVDRWARTNRGLRQEPRLFGKGEDFIVAPLGRAALEKTVPAAPDPYPAALLEGWKNHDEAWARGAFRQAARPLLRLEANLLRDESRWQGGGSKEGKEFALDPGTRNLLDELKLLAPTPAPKLMSVLSAKENPTAVASVNQVLRRATDGKKAQEEIEGILQLDKTADHPQQARTVVEALSRLPELRQEHLKVAQGVLGGLKGRVPLVEVLYVDRLAAFAEREFPETFQGAKIEVVWRTMRAHEAVQAALAREPEFLPWVASDLEKADKERRAAEGKLLWERPPVWPQALLDLQASGETYDRVRKRLEVMQNGNAALERAFAELPVHLRVLADDPDADPYADQTWFKAAAEAAILQKFFVTPPNARPVADARIAWDLWEHLDELNRLFRERIKKAGNADTPAAQRQMRCLLQSPRLKAAERADLFKKLRDGAKKLHDATETNDPPASKAVEPDAGKVRAQMSLALLRLAGIDTEPAAPDLAALEKKLHLGWGADGLVKRWREASADRRGQAISRLVSPWDPQTKDEDPGRLWQSKLREEHLDWLKAQYEAESREAGPPNRKADDARDQAMRDFYRDAAQ